MLRIIKRHLFWYVSLSLALNAPAQDKWTLPNLHELPQTDMLGRKNTHLRADEIDFLRRVTAHVIATCVEDPGPGDPRTADGLFASLRVKRAELAPNGAKVFIVQGNDVCMCGAVGNCSFWLITEGPKLTIVLKAIGIQTFAIQRDTTNGYFDVILGSHDSAMQTDLQKFKFDGQKYRLRGCATIDWDDLAGEALHKPRITPMPCS